MRPNQPKRVAHPCSETSVLCNGTHCLLLLLLLPWSCCIHLTWNRDTFSFQQKKKSKTTAAKLKSENLKNWRYKFFITIIIIVIRCNKAQPIREGMNGNVRTNNNFKSRMLVRDCDAKKSLDRDEDNKLGIHLNGFFFIRL